MLNMSLKQTKHFRAVLDSPDLEKKSKHSHLTDKSKITTGRNVCYICVNWIQKHKKATFYEHREDKEHVSNKKTEVEIVEFGEGLLVWETFWSLKPNVYTIICHQKIKLAPDTEQNYHP